MANFIILIGGPGTYESCDPAHDKTWLNYFYPIQAATDRDLYLRGSDTVHWVVYQPAYRVRWLEDSEITFWEGAAEMISGKALHKVRKKGADDVASKGAKNYLDRIQTLAKGSGVTYQGIETPKGFWDYLGSFGTNSISRVWYCGHATVGGLILELTHDAQCQASWTDASTVLKTDIGKQAALKDRFVKGTKSSSRFYGCNTLEFARDWHATFGVPTEGAGSSITFARIFDGADGVLKRLETNPTGSGDPSWTKFE